MGLLARTGALLAAEAYHDLALGLKGLPWHSTKILNKSECNVAGIAPTFRGKLCWRARDMWNATTKITRIEFHDSYVRSGYIPRASMVGEFTIHTPDGRKIEVWSCDRKILQAAYNTAVALESTRRDR